MKFYTVATTITDDDDGEYSDEDDGDCFGKNYHFCQWISWKLHPCTQL